MKFILTIVIFLVLSKFFRYRVHHSHEQIKDFHMSEVRDIFGGCYEILPNRNIADQTSNGSFLMYSISYLIKY